MRTWLSISAIAALFIFGCCGQKSTTDVNSEKAASAPVDTSGRHEAPKHHSPDQDRIDSLKREKEKNKH